MLLTQMPGREAEAEHHRRAAREAVENRRKALNRLEVLQQQARHRAIDRAAAESERAASPNAAPANVSPVPDDAPHCEFIIVSGLPRSGTSLMMRMLNAAGVPVMSDGERKADAANPGGYFEWEAVKQIGRKPEILREADGKAIKVVSALLPALPRRHRYKVIFMDRPIEEVVESQRKMIGDENRGIAKDRMPAVLAQHRGIALDMLRRAKQSDVLIIEYPNLVANPAPWIDKIAAFLGPEKIPHPERMTAVIQPELYRTRALLAEAV
jgi:hypothetical protein